MMRLRLLCCDAAGKQLRGPWHLGVRHTDGMRQLGAVLGVLGLALAVSCGPKSESSDAAAGGSVSTANIGHKVGDRAPEISVNLESGDECVVVEGRARQVQDVASLSPVVARYEAKYHWKMEPAPGEFWVVRPRVAFGWLCDGSGLDGGTLPQTIRWFAQHAPGAAIFALLEQPDHRHRQEALEAGADYVCSKPDLLVAQLRYEFKSRGSSDSLTISAH